MKLLTRRKEKLKKNNIEKKLGIISKLEGGNPNKDLVVEYGVSYSTVSTVWEKRETLLRTFIQNETMNTNNEKAVPINGSILQKPNEALSRV